MELHGKRVDKSLYNNIFYQLFDAEEHQKFIKSIEKQFRGSPEYALWLNSVVHREECGATGMSKIDDAIDIEVHHCGMRLWDWVEYIIDKFIENGLNLNSHYICLILSDIHLSNYISYIPLMHCIHKMVHGVGIEDVILKYPNIIDNIYEGNTLKAFETIDYHIKIVKNILENDNKTKNEIELKHTE